MMRLRHARTTIALHELAHGDGLPLLVLHPLGGSSADWRQDAAAWPGRVIGVDFSGHGDSPPLPGGAYWPELLLGDADVALEQIAPAAVAGAGLGAYIALLLAGSRPQAVPAALLLPGRGLAGGGPQPDFDRPFLTGLTPSEHPPLPAGCDPLCCALDLDPRPPEYAARFAAAASRLLLLEDDAPRPPWWDAARAHGEVVRGTWAQALERLRRG
ncbi:alpha/beta hydrolase [bacterium]|nr:alpha/beta hydrolase [bacterium]